MYLRIVMRIIFINLMVLLLPVLVLAQTRTVTGKVTSSEDNTPIPGVNVVVQGTSKGTVTDVDGNYSTVLTLVPGKTS
jgi:TonB-dependent starch-binding outer membrane protein SusC